MKDETKNAEKTNIGEPKPKFQHAEPGELNEDDLQVVSGGGIIMIDADPPQPDGLPLI